VAQLVQVPGTDIEAIIRHYQLESSTLARDITAALDRLAARLDLDHRLSPITSRTASRTAGCTAR
jgi:hypothetical protein